MTAIFIAFLNMSITASIVALAVMLARIPLRKAPKIFSYALWGVVMFRLIFPFSFESIFSLMPTPANIIPPDIVSSQNLQSPAVQLADTPVSVTAYSAMPIIRHVSEANPVVTVIEAAGYVWLAGIIVLLAYAAYGYVSLKRRICFATLVRDNIYETDRIKSPFVLGFIRPKIYFPSGIDPSRHDYILKHEQVHIQRYDYLIKPFAYIVFALHWFNPLMWIAYFLMSKDMEMSCDEAVLRRTDEDIRRDYSTSLLSLSIKRAGLLNPIASAFGESSVRERITNVLKFKKTANWVTVVSIIAVGVFLVGFSSDRVLAIDVPSSAGGAYADTMTFNITSWHTDEQGARVAGPEEAQEIGLYVLNKYFSVFSNDWESWGSDSFSLVSHPAFFDEYGIAHTQPWTGGVFADELTIIENAIWGDTYFYAPLFLFYIDAETGRLDSTTYITPADTIMTDIAPFAFSFEEALDIYGNGWHELSSVFQKAYVEMLIGFSLEFLDESELLSSEVISADIVVAWSNFFDNHVTADFDVSFSSGMNAILSFRVYETYFALEALSFRF